MCQHTKVENIAPRGKLQLIPAANIPWRDLAMDFLINLPESGGSMSVLVVVDCFSKMVHLVPLLSSTEAMDVAAAFFDLVVHLHGFTCHNYFRQRSTFLKYFLAYIDGKIYGNYVEIQCGFSPVK